MRIWHTARKTTQYATLLLFLFSADLFFRLDPLASLAAMVAGRTVLSGLLVSGLVVVSALVVSRGWCGWVCPTGTVLELLSPRRPRKWSAIHSHEEGLRHTKYVLLSVILAAAVLGNLTLLVADPITILWRSIAVVVRPLIDALVTRAETALYPVPLFRPPLEWVEQTFRGNLLLAQYVPFRFDFLIGTLLVTLVALNWVAPRFFCRYLCPLGALLSVPSRASLLRPRMKETCNRCGACARLCPTGAIAPEGDGAIDSAECVMCLDCYERCPRRDVAMTGHPELIASRFDPSRRRVLASLAAAAAGVPLINLADELTPQSYDIILPPGAERDEFLSCCMRCGMCMERCPTQGLRPSLLESGLAGIWTPRLVARKGYCDFSCTACGKICPTGAIPRLTLEKKRRTVLGRALIDRRRCLPWAEKTQCIVCQEMCPVSPEAIVLDDVEILDESGERILLRRPVVKKNRCIGCGACEYNCPVEGEAAIRVLRA